MKSKHRKALERALNTPAKVHASFGAELGDRIPSGQSLGAGSYIISPNRLAKAVMQSDGNLVLIKVDENRPLWASKSNGSGAVSAKMQDDGNLVLLDSGNNPKWSTGTNGHPGAYLRVQDDGNLVLYQYGLNLTLENGEHPLWATGTQGFNSQLHAGEFEWSDVSDGFIDAANAVGTLANNAAGSVLQSGYLLNLIPGIGPAAALLVQALGPISTIIPGLIEGQSLKEATIGQIKRAVAALGGGEAAAAQLAKELPVAANVMAAVQAMRNARIEDIAAQLHISVPSAETAFAMIFGDDALAANRAMFPKVKKASDFQTSTTLIGKIAKAMPKDIQTSSNILTKTIASIAPKTVVSAPPIVYKSSAPAVAPLLADTGTNKVPMLIGGGLGIGGALLGGLAISNPITLGIGAIGLLGGWLIGKKK